MITYLTSLSPPLPAFYSMNVCVVCSSARASNCKDRPTTNEQPHRVDMCFRASRCAHSCSLALIGPSPLDCVRVRAQAYERSNGRQWLHRGASFTILLKIYLP